MYVGGEEYNTMNIYRTERLKRFLEETLPVSGENDYAIFLNNLFNEFSVTQISDFTDTELNLIMEEIYHSRGATLIERSSEGLSEKEELEQMMTEYNRARGITTPVSIKTSGMKTIIIDKQ